jgi:hypothetical protein
METTIDLDIGFPDILKDPDYFKTLTVDKNGIAHLKLDQSLLVPEYLTWLDSLGLEIKLAELFYCGPGAEIFVHSDEIETPNCCKMNWAYCDSEVTMDWYAVDPGTKIEQHNNTIGGYYLSCDPQHYSLYKSAAIGRPSLVNVSNLHGVKNTSNNPWWCVTIVLRKKNADEHRISWNELLEIVTPWIRTI